MQFISKISKDELDLILIQKIHKAIFIIKCVDDVNEHVNLVKFIENLMRKEDIKWIDFGIKFTYCHIELPPNAIIYTNKHNGNLICHIEDFNKFYFMNIHNFIRLEHIYYKDKDSKNYSKNEWILVGGPKKSKKVKYDKILKDLSKIILL